MAKQPISEKRKTVYYIGMGIAALGIFLIIVGFIAFAILGFLSVDSFGQSPSPLIGFFMVFAGMVLSSGGIAVCGVAKQGLAGSGLILDPEQARKDVEPWSRMTGGVVKDTIEETGLLSLFPTQSQKADASPNTTQDSPSAARDFDTELRKLHQLHQDGILSQEEYESAKTRILKETL
ncbi:MAG: SHOCT domain-containing protein [Phycisphaerae bacterium]|nr:SHOCT domain-containing protein [Phycisphaerae bacterium]